MNEFQVKNRTIKAMKLADALETAGATAVDCTEYDAPVWILATTVAGVIPPSDVTKELVVSLLADREAKAGQDPFVGL